jgi:hypothetical protein
VPSSDEVFFPKGTLAKKMCDDVLVTLGDTRPCHPTVKNWVARFPTGHLSAEDEELLERPSQVAILENANAILKVSCLHPVACTMSGSGFPSNATLV